MIRFPRRGVEGAVVLAVKRGGKWGRRVRARKMCNWIDCEISFDEEPSPVSDGGSEGSEGSFGSTEGMTEITRIPGQTCSKCKLVKYCSLEHQKKDWDEHRRVCAKPL
jgi:hypothetical protein